MKDKYLIWALIILIPVNVVLTIGNFKNVPNEVVTRNVLPVNKDKELKDPVEVRKYVGAIAEREGLNVMLIDNIVNCESTFRYNAISPTGKYQGLWQISSIHNLGDDRLDVIRSTRWAMDKMKRDGYGAWECSRI